MLTIAQTIYNCGRSNCKPDNPYSPPLLQVLLDRVSVLLASNKTMSVTIFSYRSYMIILLLLSFSKWISAIINIW